MADDTNKTPRRKQRGIKNDLQAAGSQPTFVPRSEELNSKEIKRLEGFTGDTVKRLNYFTGQFLEATDFTTEQDYHIDMRRAGNRALYYSAGILDGGFVVEPAGNNAITVSAGIAVDANGRELVIISSRLHYKTTI